jgi:uncharacterized delta-60 repeat protein
MRTLALSVALALTVVGSALAAPRPGTLDRGFGGDGRVETPVSGKYRVVVGVESLPGGKALVVGTADHRLVLIRYRRNGSLDRSFGRKGIATFDFGRYFTATDTVLDSQGRLLVVGSLGVSGTQSRDAALLRFDGAGHLDSALDQDGIALVDFGGPKGDEGKSLALAPNGQILLGALVRSFAYDYGGGVGIARLDPSGALDKGFGNQGLVVHPPHDSFDTITPEALTVLPDGGVVAGVNYGGPKGNSPMAAKLLPSGAFDTNFIDYSTPGWRNVGEGDEGGLADLVFDPATGQAVVVGSASESDGSGHGLWLNAFNLADGTLQRGELIAVDRRQTSAGALAIDGSGRRVVAGTAQFDRPSKYGWHYGQTHFEYMIVARAKASGKLERCFGRGGVVRIWFRGRLSVAAAVAITPGGKILVAGPAWYAPEDAPHRFQVARLHGGDC